MVSFVEVAETPIKHNLAYTPTGRDLETKSMALDLIKFKINVNCIAPTKIITKKNENKKILKIIKNKIPQKKFPKVREVAEVCYFLCSGKVNSITGSTIVIDGGWTIL